MPNKMKNKQKKSKANAISEEEGESDSKSSISQSSNQTQGESFIWIKWLLKILNPLKGAMKLDSLRTSQLSWVQMEAENRTLLMQCASL